MKILKRIAITMVAMMAGIASASAQGTLRIGMTVAVRNLMHDLRSAGEVTGGPPPFGPRDRSAFLSALDQAIRRLQRTRGLRWRHRWSSSRRSG